MFSITKRKQLNENTVLMDIKAPRIATKALPGQFVIIRVDDKGERIPLTIAGNDPESGNVTIIFQAVGATTMKLADKTEGEYVQDIVGPLGNASELDGLKKVAVIGGGLGCAIAYPQAKYLHDHGASVDVIVGFRNKDLIILEDEMKACCDKLYVFTDDGSNGNKGLVTNGLKDLIDAGTAYDAVIAIGPPIMMKFVSLLTKEYGIKTIVSMNPIMIDGTGMCGGCRVTVDGKMKFACVDGPDFDGHKVDFDELMSRNGMYREYETESCNLYKAAKEAEING